MAIRAPDGANNRYYLSDGHLQENTHSALTSCMKGERMGAGARTSCCLRFWKITLDYSSPWRFYHLLVVMHFCQLSATHILQYTCTLAYICSFLVDNKLCSSKVGATPADQWLMLQIGFLTPGASNYSPKMYSNRGLLFLHSSTKA